MITRYQDIPSYITKDGSTIRELMHPDSHGNCNQSLAEATVPLKTTTELHLHKESEEIYFIKQGQGLMTVGEEKFNVSTGDTISIPANTSHQIENTGKTELIILCACSPPYSHDDTILLDT